MKTYVLNYPGDPPCEILEMSREEFLALFPRTPIQTTTFAPDGQLYIERQHLEPDEIICDYCCADPGPTVWVCERQKAVCCCCWLKAWKPYCEEARDAG